MARTDPQVNLRIPADLKDKIDQAAKDNGRSMTSEIVARLQASFEDRSAETTMGLYASGARSGVPTLLTDPEAFAELVAKKLKEK